MGMAAEIPVTRCFLAFRDSERTGLVRWLAEGMESTMDKQGFEKQGKIRSWKMMLPPNLPPKNSRHAARIRGESNCPRCSRKFQKEQWCQLLRGVCSESCLIRARMSSARHAVQCSDSFTGWESVLTGRRSTSLSCRVGSGSTLAATARNPSLANRA